MPGASAGDHECDCSDQNETITDSFAGPWCFCADPAPGEEDKQYCMPPDSVPEQINLQMAAPDALVASFVTYEALPTEPPVAMLGLSPQSMQPVTGVSHFYNPHGSNRTYILSYVKFSNLKERTR